jgi:hypothetical protein
LGRVEEKSMKFYHEIVTIGDAETIESKEYTLEELIILEPAILEKNQIERIHICKHEENLPCEVI